MRNKISKYNKFKSDKIQEDNFFDYKKNEKKMALRGTIGAIEELQQNKFISDDDILNAFKSTGRLIAQLDMLKNILDELNKKEEND